MTLNCIHIFIVTSSFLYWCVMRPASQRFFSIYLRILIISYLATFFGINSLSVLMCRKAVNQSINIRHKLYIFYFNILYFIVVTDCLQSHCWSFTLPLSDVIFMDVFGRFTTLCYAGGSLWIRQISNALLLHICIWYTFYCKFNLALVKCHAMFAGIPPFMSKTHHVFQEMEVHMYQM